MQSILGLLEKCILRYFLGLGQQNRFFRWLGGIAPPSGTWLFGCLIDPMQQRICKCWDIVG